MLRDIASPTEYTTATMGGWAYFETSEDIRVRIRKEGGTETTDRTFSREATESRPSDWEGFQPGGFSLCLTQLA